MQLLSVRTLLPGIIIMLFMPLTPMYAQSYHQSAGVRLGTTSAVTYKKFIVPEESVEFMFSGRREGAQFTIMFVKHRTMEFSFNENFFAYYGLGGHFGLERYDGLSKAIVPGETPSDPVSFVYEEKNYFVMGADAIAGVEYRWLSVPITISFDLKPYFNYIGMRYIRGTVWDGAISFKYVF